MPKSGYWSQQCRCGTNRRAVASVTLSGSTLGKVPRHKSPSVTVYVCEDCVKKPGRKTRMAIVAAVIGAVKGALAIPKVAKIPAVRSKR